MEVFSTTLATEAMAEHWGANAASGRLEQFPAAGVTIPEISCDD